MTSTQLLHKRMDHPLDLSWVLDTVIDDRVKGIPGGTTPFTLERIGTRGWNVLAQDLPLPIMLLQRSALESNLKTMQSYCEHFGVRLAPHGKTTMAPQLFAAQLAAGAWAITAATVEQLNVYCRLRVPRVIFANQVIGHANVTEVIRRLAGDPRFELISFVDSQEAIRALADAARAVRLDRQVEVIIEIGYMGGRTGVRDRVGLDTLCAAIRRNEDVIRLVGIGGFEGLLEPDRPVKARELQDSAVHAFLQQMVSATVRLGDQGLLPDDFIITAGGSRTFDAVVEVLRPVADPPAQVVLRSGCYVTHDHGMYAKSSPLHQGNTPVAESIGNLAPALEVWTYVQSVPEPGLALLTCGRRDVPYDSGLPIPLSRIPVGTNERQALSDSAVTELNDQHAYVRGNDQLSVGDRVVLGISHPCTAFDKWRLIPVVDDDYTVVDAVLTFF